MQALRLVIVETLDPDGALYAWMSSGLRELGHEVVVVPAQELVPRMGVDAWQELLLDLDDNFAPHLILSHPPYDFLGAGVAEKLRGRGVRLVGFAFDDPVFLETWREDGTWGPVVASIQQRFDLYATTSREMARVARATGGKNVQHLRWAITCETDTACTESTAAVAPQKPLLLLGSAYPRRLELVSALSERGIQIEVAGQGWLQAKDQLPDSVTVSGPVPGDLLDDAFREATGVICPSDWEDRAVPMVKARLLEVTRAGGLVLTEDSPELADYFNDDEVLRFHDVEELSQIALALESGQLDGATIASRARARTRAEHTWEQRWPELLGLLGQVGSGIIDRLAPPDGANPGTAWGLAISNLALDLEQKGATRAAVAAYRCLERYKPENFAILAGLGRCFYTMNQPKEALPYLERALSAGVSLVGEDTSTLPLRWPGAPKAGLGLGYNGYLSPRLEVTAFRLAALLGAGEVQQALEAIEAIDDPDWLIALSQLLNPTDDAQTQPFWERLTERSKKASPRLLSRDGT